MLHISYISVKLKGEEINTFRENPSDCGRVKWLGGGRRRVLGQGPTSSDLALELGGSMDGI